VRVDLGAKALGVGAGILANIGLLNPVRFGQLTHDPAAETSFSSCLSKGAEAN
jgi:hypothetical protein